jgi:ABC-type uncharacterized transport system ATPase subunit
MTHPDDKSGSTPFAVECRSLAKRFGNCIANSDVSLNVQAGMIHGLVGENGAGKSTCVKMLYGLYKPDDGQILIHGRQVSFSSPMDAIQAGIGMVHQHFMLSGTHTVLDNIILGAEPVVSWAKFLSGPLQVIDRSFARQKLRDAMSSWGLDVPLDAKVEALPVGVQQRIEILKLLWRDAKILILDEPTAVLTPLETKTLFDNLRRLRDLGHTIIIITHKLEEVLELTSDVTVLRAGRVVGQVRTADTDLYGLARMMVGRDVNLHMKVAPARVSPEATPSLKLNRVSLESPGRKAQKPLLRDVSFDVRPGEIVGIAGVEGNGQREVFEVITRVAGNKSDLRGEIQLFGEDAVKLVAGAFRRKDVGIVPFDRHREGLLLEATASENLILGHQGRKENHKWGVLRPDKSRQLTMLRENDVRPADLLAIASAFSGGNQQKLIFARELASKPRLVLAANPIRGVDVGAIEFIHSTLVAARDNGAGVLLFSADLDEVLTLSDRILVFYEGQIVGQFTRVNASRETIGVLMGGGRSKEAAKVNA